MQEQMRNVSKVMEKYKEESEGNARNQKHNNGSGEYLSWAHQQARQA